MTLIKNIKINEISKMCISLSYMFYLFICDLKNQVSIDLNPELLDFLDKYEKEVLPHIKL